jgi:hypothetical protein
MSDKKLEQRINIKFCVKIDKSASETLALFNIGLWWICYEYIECFLNGIGSSRKGEKGIFSTGMNSF